MKPFTQIAMTLICGILLVSKMALEQVPPPSGRGDDHKYTLEQAMSDRAQLHTVGFSGLAFLTGDFGASTFIPPGKVCDYFGFQYMRDIDEGSMGHNPEFMNRVAGNIFHVLDDSQKQQFMDLAMEQCKPLKTLAEMRFPLINAFWRQRQGDIPAGSTGLNKQSTAHYVGNIFAKDADLSYRKAQVLASVYLSLTADQKAYLGSMKFGNSNTWQALDERDELRKPKPSRDPLFNVAYMTYATEFFSWIAGSVDADTYFCPERHGTYFGGFYMKDMPAMGKRQYSISTSLTGDSGEAFIDQVLTPQQRERITAIPDLQRADLQEAASVRRAISIELRKFLKGETPDKEKVIALGRRYGQLDGEMSWMYATAFARVAKTLTPDQQIALTKLRNLDGYTSAPAYIYSQPLQILPNIPNADEFFFAKVKK